ncbi:phytanoyl-CoA dioxygenase family protein [Streptomyces collinus]
MRLTQQQVDQYHASGFLLVESLLDRDEVRQLTDAFRRDCKVPGPHLVTEDGGSQVRAVYASHRRQPEYGDLVRDPRILPAVRQLLPEDVYVYQFKINAKPAFGGDKWAWHQDYLAWRIADALPAPLQVNIGVFLDDVTEFNGPVIFLPGSHRSGLVHRERKADAKSAQHLDPDDISLHPEQLAALVDRHGMTSPKGPAGSVVFFSPEIVHGSAPNMSPWARRLLIATYNACSNPPRPYGEPRPDYVVCRDTAPLRPLEHRFSDALGMVTS